MLWLASVVLACGAGLTIATLYLLATYREKAFVWVPPYLGLVSGIPALGLGLAWMLGKL